MSELPVPEEVAASAYLPEELKPDIIIETGLRSFVLKYHQSAVSARLAVYYYQEYTYVLSVEHYGESPDDWRFRGIIPVHDVRDWYVDGFIENLLELIKECPEENPVG